MIPQSHVLLAYKPLALRPLEIHQLRILGSLKPKHLQFWHQFPQTIKEQVFVDLHNK